MASPLGLTLYNLGQRREPGEDQTRPARPTGRLLWLHAPGEGLVSPMRALARRLVEEDGLPVLLTAPVPVASLPGVIVQPPPVDSPVDARAFLDHWRPEIAVFAGGQLRPAVMHETAERKIPMLVVNGKAPAFLRERDGWYPGLMRSALARFRAIMAVDEAAARAFRKGGAALSAVAVTGRMEEESAVLPGLEAERAALASLLAARPVWFAAGVIEAEEEAVLQAHRKALQHSHRLLLILMPEDPARAATLARKLEAGMGWAVAQRARDEEPEPDIEVFVVDNPAEYGLWYRLAPVTFLGGSLLGKGPVRTPMEAAALGSAILHGPRTGQSGPVFARLGAARATRAVASASDLGDALGDLLAPDRAARLAQAAWMVASDGAEVTEGILTRLRAIMDGEE
ncbi:glycosyltransferase N-terminal domain-containing protein [Tabrizicola sp.]|jgi:3-deoxy-D-manno-octulosonic-acid transferase|uniref:3-deoxy-D-manno-octulosonic acid transferase n=1 Tax=Tabrizicola sp. TaxID=2005166 RepID=UPI001A5CF69C|nr:glycosyltransferase N-terminal domain-containing protein [Tabrizicola sp.]MBL9061789.1 3-deoxy-D-manno-octulosonic acid transferase [Tabrizicola sp.]